MLPICWRLWFDQVMADLTQWEGEVKGMCEGGCGGGRKGNVGVEGRGGCGGKGYV